MPHRDGGKMRGTHTTATDLAAETVDIVARLESVRGISLGFIQMGKGSSGGMHKVKIVKSAWGLTLMVRQSASVQEVKLYVTESQVAMEAVSRALRNNKINICFMKNV